MDGDLILILPFVIVIVAIVMSTIGGVAKRSIKFKERQMELQAGRSAPETGPLLEKIDQMEKRIRTLERIATDNSPSLAAQIDALRLEDERAAETLKEGAR